MNAPQGRLRKWFGPSQKEVWRCLSDGIDAQYVDGGFWGGDKVEATHGEWTITLDSYVVHAGKAMIVYTRMRAPYVNPDGFRFSVTRAGKCTDIAKWLGMQDVEVGHPEFDRDFVIKGTSEAQLRALFANAKIRELLALQKDMHFGVKPNSGWLRAKDMPEDADVLEFHVMGIVKDVERLKLLFALLGETLDHLCEIGSAYERAPVANEA